eukprot:4510903-Pleurochrysis_carterae.AAC.5
MEAFSPMIDEHDHDDCAEVNDVIRTHLAVSHCQASVCCCTVLVVLPSRAYLSQYDSYPLGYVQIRLSGYFGIFVLRY